MFEHVLSRYVLLVTLSIAVCHSPARAQGSSQAPTLSPVDITRFLPVRTDAMSVGPFEPRYHRTGVSQPFFLVGCDPYSLAWIARNKERLRALGALGLVVEASDAQTYRQLEAAAVGLVVRPVAANVLAEHLRIDKYPALITSEGIFP